MIRTMPHGSSVLRTIALSLALAPAVLAQTPTPTPTATPTPTPGTPTTVASGLTLSTENDHAVSGVRIEQRPDGTVWFLIPSNDRIVQLQPDGVTFKQWQIRDDKNLGANPVDFQIDGNFVWFIENGESQIDAGYSALGRLDTTTGALREWVIPGSRPAGFYRAPDGKIWIAQSGARMQSLDLASLQVVDYRSTQTFAYAHMVPGPDGALWMADFGNNRIVRWEPGAATETSWTIVDPSVGLLNPSQIMFDPNGDLWLSELSAARMDRFRPSTNELTAYGGFVQPIHFDMFAGRIYVSERPGVNGNVVVLDPGLAIGASATLTPQTLTVGSVVNKLAVTIRDTTITPTTFTSTSTAFATTDLTTEIIGIGELQTKYPPNNGYGISASGGGVWVGTDTKLVRLTLQSIGTAADLTVPVATEFGVSPGPRIQTDLTLSNKGTQDISGEALYLYSPGSFAARTTFTVPAGQTVLLTDAFSSASSPSNLELGPVRLRVTSGNAADLVASARSYQVRADGGTFGFAQVAQSSADALNAGASRILFTGSRGSEISVFGLYSPGGATATATLVAPDGTVRGTLPIAFAANVAQEFSPAASAFGVSAEPGDVIRLSVTSGSLQAYVNVFDTGTADVAMSLPASPTTGAVIPTMGEAGTFVSDLLLSNADTVHPADVVVSFAALGGSGAPALTTLTLAPGESRTIADALPTLYGVTGQGTVGARSTAPVAVAYRIASRRPEGDYAVIATALDSSEAIGDGASAAALGAVQTDTRRTDLLLYNEGAAGTVTAIALDATGQEIGRISTNIGSRQPARIDAVFARLGATSAGDARIVLQTSAGMQVYAVAAKVDVSGDVDLSRLVPTS
jgi:streptogramin lyase